MFDIKIGEEFLVDTQGTSDGTQLKYFHEGYWYKEDNVEREGEVEYLVSQLLNFSDLRPNEYVIYEQGKINGRKGCRSKNFLGADESFITLERLYTNVAGVPLYEAIKGYSDIQNRVAFVLRFVKEVTGLDLFDYFKKVFTLDYIILNEDRHFHNLGIIMDGEGNYRSAPIFDNGKSLLNGNSSRNHHLSVSENVKKVTARPFGGSHRAVYEYFGKGFCLNVPSAFAWLANEKDSPYKKVLEFQLHEVFPQR